MLDPSKCLNFVLDADACVESPFDRVTVRSVAAYPTPRRLRTRIRQPPGTCAVGIYGRIAWTNQLSHSEISRRELHRSFWRFLRSYAASATRRMTDRARRCRPKNASGRRSLVICRKVKWKYSISARCHEARISLAMTPLLRTLRERIAHRQIRDTSITSKTSHRVGAHGNSGDATKDSGQQSRSVILFRFRQGIVFPQFSCRLLSAFKGFRGGQRKATHWAIEEPRGGE